MTTFETLFEYYSFLFYSDNFHTYVLKVIPFLYSIISQNHITGFNKLIVCI